MRETLKIVLGGILVACPALVRIATWESGLFDLGLILV
jgi:hypothetical protein